MSARNTAINETASSSSSSWSLSVKAIGSTLKECHGGSSSASNNATSSSSSNDDTNNLTGETNFALVVSPDDTLTSLYDQIEDVTGLEASQQRLIYRGRIIPSTPDKKSSCTNNNGNDKKEGDDEESSPEADSSSDGSAPETTTSATTTSAADNNNEPPSTPTTAQTQTATTASTEPTAANMKIKDIVGLGDGHTIHLVKRKRQQQQQQENASDASSSDGNSTTANTNATTIGSSTGTTTTAAGGDGTASLLAALIGLGGLDEASTATATGAATGGNSEDATTAASRQRWRSARMGRSRRPHYRLTAEDLQPPDPGTLEPVRQNLMTIHTLLPYAQSVASITSPLDASRQWYRGQWMDVRDTVNQWLEATVVQILEPEDVLPPRDHASDDIIHQSTRPHQILEPATDPAVGTGDMAGRRRLLLEPCDEGDDHDLGGDLAGFQRRRTNAGVQLLLVHYNGWPHRWDEWIRSDSERIRPFRTRTRHPSMATYSSPTTQSTFNDSPQTHIVHGEEHGVERPAILPELSRAVSAINELLTVVAAEEAAQLTAGRQTDLPWAARSTPSGAPSVDDFVDAMDDDDDASDDDDDENEDELPPLLSTEEHTTDEAEASAANTSSAPVNNNNNHHNVSESQLRRRQLQMLAPLLDRLGRTLVDAAPHVAALANDSAGNNDMEESVSTAEAVVAPTPAEDNPSTLGGLLSLLSRDRRRSNRNNNSNNTNNDSGENEEEGSSNETHNTWPVDPDYVDFATGAVNTTRGEVRNGPRSRGSNDDVAGLLGAYLAAASLGLNTGGGGGGSDDNDESAGNILGLGRLLRERGGNAGNGGPGIDIHIHAVVTAPGMPPTPIGGGTGIGGALGLAAFGSPATTGTTTTRNSLTPIRDRRGGGSSFLRYRTPTTVVEEDDGLFSDLYSESPDPVDPNSSPEPARVRREERANSASENDFMTRLTQSSRSTNTSMLGAPRRSATTGAPSSRLDRQTNNSSSTRRSSSSSSRRGSMFGRLFRRSRRSSSNRES